MKQGMNGRQGAWWPRKGHGWPRKGNGWPRKGNRRHFDLSHALSCNSSPYGLFLGGSRVRWWSYSNVFFVIWLRGTHVDLPRDGQLWDPGSPKVCSCQAQCCNEKHAFHCQCLTTYCVFLRLYITQPQTDCLMPSVVDQFDIVFAYVSVASHQYTSITKQFPESYELYFLVLDGWFFALSTSGKERCFQGYARTTFSRKLFLRFVILRECQ